MPGRRRPQRLAPALAAALRAAVARVRAYHERQAQANAGFLDRDAQGNTLGMRVVPLERVGVYVPGGKASYPSTVIMNVVPAVVAGVTDIVMVTPAGGVNDAVLAAAELAGVTRLFQIGGAQAIAALAFGTRTLPRVDKIVGPGNRFVTEAKRQVAGAVGIDMLAGPTEVLIIADRTADVRYVAADLIAQAEHDEDAAAWCVTPSAELAAALDGELARQVARSPRRAIVERSLAAHGVLVAGSRPGGGRRGCEPARARAPRADGRGSLAAGGSDPARGRRVRRAAPPRSRSATTSPALRTCCRPAARRGSCPRLASTTS